MAGKPGAVLYDLCMRLSRLHPHLGSPKDLQSQLADHAALLTRIVRERGMDHAVRAALRLLQQDSPHSAEAPALSSVQVSSVQEGSTASLEGLDLGPRWSAPFCALCEAPRPIASPVVGGLPICGLCAARAHHPQVRALIDWRSQHPAEDLRVFLSQIKEPVPDLLEILARAQRSRLAQMRRYGP